MNYEGSHLISLLHDLKAKYKMFFGMEQKTNCKTIDKLTFSSMNDR